MIPIELRFTDEFGEALGRVEAKLDDLQPVFSDIGELMTERTKQRFRDGKGPDGVAWAPKSPNTIARQAKSEGRANTAPLHGPSGRLASEISYEVSSQGVSWGSSLIYSAVMQHGAEAGSFGLSEGTDKNGNDFAVLLPFGDIPARPFIGVSDDDNLAIIATFEEYLTGGLTGR